MPSPLDRIEALLATAPAGKQYSLPEIEHTLTDGYAHALALEGERLRVERRVDEVTARLDGGDTERQANELSLLTRRLARIDEELSSLRARLGVLRLRARELRNGLRPQVETG
jgi:ABC-type phosphate transport system auxiliary subunit